jgi:perosamine synthetase
MIPVNRPVISKSDIDHVNRALEQTWISGETPPIRELEAKLAELVGCEYVVAVSSGTSALDLSIEALDIQPGDICVVPAFTIISSVSNLLRKGAVLQLVDADPITWSMNANIAAEIIDKKTRLVMPVHIYGLPTDMNPIIEKTHETSTFVLEDAAEALGVTYNSKQCGSIGNAGVFSFYANKIVTGGEGGAVVSHDREFTERVRYFRNLCFNSNERFVHSDLGWNARMSGLTAALISSQLDRLDLLVDIKKQIGQRYREGLQGHPWFDYQPIETTNSENIFWVFGVLLKSEALINAKELQTALRAKDIESRRFFCPIHLQPLNYSDQIIQTANLSVSEKLWEKGLYLPSGVGTTTVEIDKTIQVLWDLAK